jgi:hypothetical protein
MKRVGIGVMFVSLGLLAFFIGFVSHLPVSFVLAQMEESLPPQLKLTQPQGRLLNGQVTVAWQDKPAGTLAWQWDPSVLTQAKLGASLDWQYQQSQLQAKVKADRQAWWLDLPQGQLNLAHIVPWLGANPMLKNLQGRLHLRDVNLEMPLRSNWPSQLTGKAALMDFRLMDIAITHMDIQPRLEPQALQLAFDGEGKGWVLDGETQWSPPNRYQFEWQLKAESAKTFPDWAGYMMRQTSPTEAVAKNQGQW